MSASDGFYFGPTLTDRDPGRMWHYGCDREVYSIDGAYVCACGAQWAEDHMGIVYHLCDPRRRVICRSQGTHWTVARADLSSVTFHPRGNDALAEIGRVCDEWAAEAQHADTLLR